jgi:hypothetical protein
VTDDPEDIFRAGEVEAPLTTQRPFTPDEMVRCEACLRVNPPTRTTCLYCAATLPMTEVARAVRRPTLRRLEEWERGFNVIHTPDVEANIRDEILNQAAGLLRLGVEDLRRIIASAQPLPLARAASLEEAKLIERKLVEMGINTLILTDEDLVSETSAPKRVRALEFGENHLSAQVVGSGDTCRVLWSEILLLVMGRIFIRRVEVEERHGRKSENEIVDAREMTEDVLLLDIYTTQADAPCLRIAADNFDFSCLGEKKALLMGQNFSTLIDVLREHASEADYDDSYNRLRPCLAPVWPLEQRTESRGLRHDRPGRMNTEAVMMSDNRAQFTRYSRLCYLLKKVRQLDAKDFDET